MIAAALLVAQYTGTAEASVNARVALRSTYPAPLVTTSVGRDTPIQGHDIVALDLQLLPVLRLHANDHFWDFGVAYTPSFTAADLEIGYSPQLLHQGGVTIGWHEKFVRLTLSENGSYGVLNTVVIYAYNQQNVNAMTGGQAQTGAGQTGQTGQTGAAAPTTPATQQPSVNDVAYGSSNSTATLQIQTGRHEALTLSGGYAFGGALTVSGKQTLSEQYGPVGTVAFMDGFDRTDSLGLLASAQNTTTSGPCPVPPNLPLGAQLPAILPWCVSQAPLFTVQSVGHHQFNAAESLTVNLGVGAAVANTIYEHALIIEPVTLVTYTDVLKARGARSLSINLGLIPTVDIRTGVPANRLSAGLNWQDLIGPRRVLTVTGQFLQSVPVPSQDPYPITSIGGSAEVKSQLDPLFDITYGLQTMWQDQSGYGTLVSAIGYVGVTARAPKARF